MNWGRGGNLNGMEHSFFSVKRRVLMQYPTIFTGVLYSVSLDFKSVTFHIHNQDLVPAPAPIFIIWSGSYSESVFCCPLRSGSGSGSGRFSSKDPDPNPAQIDSTIMVPYPNPAPNSKRYIRWRIFWIRRITRITDICDPRIMWSVYHWTKVSKK